MSTGGGKGKLTAEQVESIRRLHAPPARYHIIEPSGVVTTTQWTGALDDGCIPVQRIRELLAFEPEVDIEHVAVIWQGRPAHMFVDEIGYAHGLSVNPKATRIYMNARFRQNGLHDYLYDDLNESPMFKEAQFDANLRARLIIRSTRGMVLGRALLWEGGYE